ncbi:RNA polymerase sigma factor RpoE [Rubripirellula lacrimiformis]|uniref:RNA polymerase sigma factor RpoE n=1 Tax=Rubripirellula lacrimiformis TaxID=1930273 RepID=A0A517N6I1_9BACT|nr:sigma-70 family RNA polymerase sigma factor [Rubripirellula lacrimiformis]QDT02749.1 RNA polymerase sigma factor RpoE [Rubripirellula lacrimiformis]
MLNPETRPSLIVRLSDQQDQSAWWSFVELYEPFLKHLVARQGVPPAHQGDVVQQVLVAIAGSVSGWKDDGGDASFRRWVNRVARNVVIKFMTRQRRQISGQGGSDALARMDQHPDRIDPAIESQYRHELIVWASGRVRAEFAETSWIAFWATMIEGRDVAEVAESIGVSTGSIYMSRSRIVRRIRETIDEVLQ